MVLLRPTAKLRNQLPVCAASAQSDTALGDWYVNRVVIDRQPLLLLVSSASLLPIVIPGRDVRSLPARLAGIVGGELRRRGLEAAIVKAEFDAMTPVVVTSTADRSVIGTMVDFAFAIAHFGEDLRDQRALHSLSDWLAHTPCRSSHRADRVIYPDLKASELLRARWAQEAGR